MFGASAFGEFAFSEFVDTPLDSAAWQAFLDNPAIERCWLVEFDAFSLATVSTRSSAFGDAGFGELGFSDADAGVTGGVQTLRFGSHDYISRIFTGGVAGGDPDYTDAYRGRVIVDSVHVDRRITSRSGLGGIAEVFAEVRLLNGDGGLDELKGNYSLDGRRAQIWLGSPTWQRADFGLLFSGVVRSYNIGLDVAEFTLSDGKSKLDRPVNQTVYAGSGALEGGADLKGKSKPRAFGALSYGNVAPPLVDSSKLIYQVNDGAISDVPVVYDRGIVLTQGADYTDAADLNASAPSAGQYRVYKGGGYFRLGSTPSGEITADVLGDASGSGYVAKTGEIVQRLLIDTVGLTNSELDPTSIAQINGDQPAPVGTWIPAGDQRSVADVVDELLFGIGAFGGFNRQGAFTVGVIASPVGRTPLADFTATHILDLRREAMPAGVEPIAWRASVGYQRNFTVQTDLASGVTAARRTFAAEAQRVVKYDDSSIATRFLLAKEYGPIPGLFSASADADTEASRLFTLWSDTRRGIFTVTLKLTALTRDIGQVVTLQLSRQGLSVALPARVLEQTVRGNRVELKVLV